MKISLSASKKGNSYLESGDRSKVRLRSSAPYFIDCWSCRMKLLCMSQSR